MAIIPTYNVVNLAGISQSVIDLLLGLADEAFRMWGAVLAGNANVSVRIELVETSGAGRAEKDKPHLRRPLSFVLRIRPSYCWACIWPWICATVSITTLTTISSDVPPK